jgi:hypothetical protein
MAPKSGKGKTNKAKAEKKKKEEKGHILYHSLQEFFKKKSYFLCVIFFIKLTCLTK